MVETLRGTCTRAPVCKNLVRECNAGGEKRLVGYRKRWGRGEGGRDDGKEGPIAWACDGGKRVVRNCQGKIPKRKALLIHNIEPKMSENVQLCMPNSAFDDC